MSADLWSILIWFWAQTIPRLCAGCSGWSGGDDVSAPVPLCLMLLCHHVLPHYHKWKWDFQTGFHCQFDNNLTSREMSVGMTHSQSTSIHIHNTHKHAIIPTQSHTHIYKNTAHTTSESDQKQTGNPRGQPSWLSSNYVFFVVVFFAFCANSVMNNNSNPLNTGKSKCSLLIKISTSVVVLLY